MLQRTFLHLSGIAEHSERLIWQAGVADWMAFMAAREIPGFSATRTAGLRSGVVESIQRYQQADWSFFDQRLSGKHKWRAFGDLAERALYVDIETDGDLGPEAITVIGAYDGTTSHLFVRGRNLYEAQALLESAPLVVTYNGASFDLPLIRALFPNHRMNHVHIDLLHPLRRLGYGGGLKVVEKRLGIRRSAETDGLDGWEAVRLWHNYEQFGDEQALQTLLRYNEEDIQNLKPLMNFAFRELARGVEAGPV